MNDSERQELRLLAATSRFKSAWTLLSSNDDFHMLNGMRGIKRMLENRGRSFDDLLTIIAHGHNERPAQNQFKPEPEKPAPPPIDSIEQRAASLLARTTFNSEGLPVIGIYAMPSAVDGVPTIVAREDTPFGEIILFCVISRGACYGPIAATTKETRERVETADRLIMPLRVHVSGPYPHCKAIIAVRIYPRKASYA